MHVNIQSVLRCIHRIDILFHIEHTADASTSIAPVSGNPFEQQQIVAELQVML